MKWREWLLIVFAAISAIAFGTEFTSASPPAVATTTQPALQWLDSLDSGYQRSQQTGRPMLVFVGGDWVAASRQAWDALQSPQFNEKLQGWTLVRLSPDKSALRSLGVVSVPAIRVLSTDGKLVAEKNEAMSADQLAAWLSLQERNLQAPAAAGDSSGSASADALIQRLGDADTTTREAAIRALRTDRSVSTRVVDLLSSESLGQRISAVDLLEQWGAPVTDIDPWNRATVTSARLTALRAWAAAKAPATTTSSTRPSIDLVLASQELDALMTAPDETQARAVRERLVRFGEPLLPQIYQRLKKNPQDPARQRLVALRYRVVATDRLALDWPGGFDRLASADPAVRRVAMGELGSHATPEDHRLLSELFADDDPFVREQSLRLLRSVGGADTGAALIGLLHDPEPNVRAAVLKTLADSPDASLAKDLVSYVGTETDTDLIVHAVHVLQVTPGPETFECLVGLLTHPQWRVRGEAAEAMLGKLSGRETDGVTGEQKAVGYAALIKRLDDEDGYVVNRAAFTLIKSDLSTAAAALLKAAERRPEIARDVLGAVANDQNVGKKLLPQIRALTKSEQPQVRAAAVTAMAELAPQTSGSVIKAALDDPDRMVRVAAIRAVVVVLDQLLPRNGTVTHSSWFGLSETTEQVVMSTWVEGFRKGVDRPPWMGEIADKLAKGLGDPETRVVAAVGLCALGQETQAWPVLTAAVKHPDERSDAAKALVWLPWDKRIELFQLLMQTARGGEVALILEQFVTVPDDRAAEPVWALLGPKATVADLESTHDALRKLYMGEQYYNIQAIAPERLTAAIKATKEKAKNGAELQRTAALSLLLMLAPDMADKSAHELYVDPSSNEWLRLDALQVMLQAEPVDQATTTASNAVADKATRKVALPFLAAGSEAVREVRGTLDLYSSASSNSTFYSGQGEPVIISPPAGLTIQPLQEVMKETSGGRNVDLSGYAGYLMVLLGDTSGFDPLLQAARAHNMEDTWAKLVFRAIAKMNDDAKTPLLEEVYHDYMKNRNWEVRELYWTIRPMTGPNALKLRKTIRDEYGMDKLR